MLYLCVRKYTQSGLSREPSRLFHLPLGGGVASGHPWRLLFSEFIYLGSFGEETLFNQCRKYYVVTVLIVKSGRVVVVIVLSEFSEG